jgi:hypothetical protein
MSDPLQAPQQHEAVSALDVHVQSCLPVSFDCADVGFVQCLVAVITCTGCAGGAAINRQPADSRSVIRHGPLNRTLQHVKVGIVIRLQMRRQTQIV